MKNSKQACAGDAQDPEKLGRESDGAFLKRIMPILPEPVNLPEHHDDYFECAGATVMPLNALRTTKSAPENAASSVNAAKAMAAAKAGIVAKRDPLKVRARGDGSFDILDGNATFTAGQYYGWVSIPVLFDKEPLVPSASARIAHASDIL